MSAPEPAVREEELHAYVDGQLPSARLPAVMRHLDASPADAARVARYGEQRQALRAAFAAHETDPLQPELDLSRLM
ncbi:MAG: anti-sigma factor family protein, partial [Acetobacteraceae bacterium]